MSRLEKTEKTQTGVNHTPGVEEIPRIHVETPGVRRLQNPFHSQRKAPEAPGPTAKKLALSPMKQKVLGQMAWSLLTACLVGTAVTEAAIRLPLAQYSLRHYLMPALKLSPTIFPRLPP